MFTDAAKEAFLAFAIRPVENPVLSALDQALRAAPDAPPSQTAGALLDLSSLNPVFGVLMSLLLLHFSRRYCNEDGETTTGTRVLLTAFLMFLSICIFRISPLGLSVIVLTSVMDAFRENTRAMTLWSIVACVACVFFSPFFIFAPLAFLLLKRYDEEKGELNPWIKYLVYPTMLVAFYFAFPLLFL